MKFSTTSDVNINIEYCGVCDYGGHCKDLAQKIKDYTPDATVICNKGRQGAFEVAVNDKLVYSKLRTMALPDFDEVVNLVNDVSLGGEIKEIKGQQPINCVIA